MKESAYEVQAFMIGDMGGGFLTKRLAIKVL